MQPAGPAPRSVRAAVLSGPGQDVEICELELAAPRAGEVEVEIAAAGVCGSDVHVVRGEWDVPLPVVLGHEGAGVVSGLGPEVAGLAIGDHVVLSWAPLRALPPVPRGSPVAVRAGGHGRGPGRRAAGRHVALEPGR